MRPENCFSLFSTEEDVTSGSSKMAARHVTAWLYAPKWKGWTMVQTEKYWSKLEPEGLCRSSCTSVFLRPHETHALLTPDGLTVIIQSNGTAPSYCWNRVYVSFDPDHCGGQLIAINCDHTRTISKYLWCWHRPSIHSTLESSFFRQHMASLQRETKLTTYLSENDGHGPIRIWDTAGFHG